MQFLDPVPRLDGVKRRFVTSTSQRVRRSATILTTRQCPDAREEWSESGGAAERAGKALVAIRSPSLRPMWGLSSRSLLAIPRDQLFRVHFVLAIAPRNAEAALVARQINGGALSGNVSAER